MFLFRQLPAAAAEKIWLMWNDGVATLFRPLLSGNPLRPLQFLDHQHQIMENRGNFLSPPVSLIIDEIISNHCSEALWLLCGEL